MKATNVWKIINHWDPMDIVSGASIDAYKFQIGKIMSLYDEVKDVEKLAKGIYDIFKGSFGKDFKYELHDCIRIAKMILTD